MRTDFPLCVFGMLLVTVAAGFAQPVITNQPQSQAVAPGANVSFSVVARGTEPIGYRWQRNPGTGFSDLADGTKAVLTLSNVQPWDAMDYRVVLTDLSGASTSIVARLYVLLRPVLTNRVVIDDFDDNNRSGWREYRRGPISETNQQLTVTGYWPGIPTRSPPDTIAVAWFDRTWRIADGQCIEWRVDLVDMNPAASAACIEPGNGVDTAYVFMKGRDWIKLNKWINGPSHWLYERAQLPNANVILAFALTRVSPDTILTARVLDKSNRNAVLYERSIVDTPRADRTLLREEQLALSGMDLSAVSDAAVPPLSAGSAVLLDTWQFNDGNQPRAAITFDNFELWSYKLPTVRYVDAASANATPPYTNWLTAANTIQDAIDAATAGDVIVVTNGIYASGGRMVRTNLLVNRAAVDKPVRLQSVNGPQFTVIQGYQVPGTTNGDAAIRCVYLAGGASLSGFTLMNGGTRTNGGSLEESCGGGLWCESTNAVTSNCVLTANSAAYMGGGTYGGAINNCTLSDNWAGNWGGGAAGTGLNPCILDHSTLTANSAGLGGGASDCTLNNCVLTDNLAFIAGGGAIDGTLNNCTLTGNRAGSLGGVAAGDVQGTCFVNNCILYYNTAPEDPNYPSNPVATTFLSYCCTIPTPDPWQGAGNVTNAPLFLDYAGGNLRLQSNSPCINAGFNASVADATDLEGNPRIVSGTVDIGAYEYQDTGSLISYGWLQQYGLPTDGSEDTLDSDNDGHTTWQEWRCGTCPTNALSVLRMDSIGLEPAGVVVRWQSVSGQRYFLQRSTNLAAEPAFQTIATNIAGQLGTTAYSDTNTAGTGPLCYRVGVR